MTNQRHCQIHYKNNATNKHLSNSPLLENIYYIDSGKEVILVMVSISLCMIVKNEEDVIGRCLASVKDLVDEINIMIRVLPIVQRKSLNNLLIEFLILNGFIILQQHEIFHFNKQQRSIFYGLMQTMYF